MAKLFQSLKKSDIQYLSNLYTLSVRWATKPRWLPIAKTKVFRVHPRPVMPEEETEEVKKLYNVYRTRMKSLKKFFEESYRASATSEEVLQKLDKEKEDFWKICMEVNDEWNRKVAVERTQRDAQYWEKELEAIHEEIVIEDEKRLQERKKLNELVIKEKEASKNFITEKNIDEAIERVLSSTPHSFYYAIDRQGQIYPGLSDTPEQKMDGEEEEEDFIEEIK